MNKEEYKTSLRSDKTLRSEYLEYRKYREWRERRERLEDDEENNKENDEDEFSLEYQDKFKYNEK